MATEPGFEIFLSYRRDDSSGHAGRLHDALQSRYGEEQVFMDVATIEPGLDFLEAIDRAIQRCDVFLPVIGRQWSAIEDVKGRRRLDSSTDPVRLETEAALKRPGLRIIPILVDGASMPSVEELPTSLSRLSTRTAHELSHRRWRYDVEQLMLLIDKIRRQVSSSSVSKQSPAARNRRRHGWGWAEYERDSGHAPALIKLVRELAEQVSALTDWTMSPSKNAVVFRSHGRVALTLQFWQRSKVRVTIPDVGSRPDPDPLSGFEGRLGKDRQWSWYVPVIEAAPDLQAVVRYAAARLEPRQTTPQRATTEGTKMQTENVAQDVLIVAAGDGIGDYRSDNVYMCQPGRRFRQGIERIGFYVRGEILPFFPLILAHRDHVPINSDEARRLLSSDDGDDQMLGDVVERMVAKGYTGDEPHGTNQIFFLTPPDDEDTLVLPTAIRNTKKDRHGNPNPWTFGQPRYVSSDVLRRNPSTTDELESI